MPENTEHTAEAGEETEQSESEFEAITSQEEFDKRLAARLSRERKKFEDKFGDYDEIKAKAAKLEEIEQANKTEAEKAAARAEAAEKRAAELEVGKLRSDVAADKGVPAALLTGSTQEELEESADALIAFRGEQKSAPSSSALGRVNQGKVQGTTADQFAQSFGQLLDS